MTARVRIAPLTSRALVVVVVEEAAVDRALAEVIAVAIVEAEVAEAKAEEVRAKPALAIGSALDAVPTSLHRRMHASSAVRRRVAVAEVAEAVAVMTAMIAEVVAAMTVTIAAAVAEMIAMIAEEVVVTTAMIAVMIAASACIQKSPRTERYASKFCMGADLTVRFAHGALAPSIKFQIIYL